MPAMLDRSPTTTALAAGSAARASSALAALRACSVTECPSSASSLAAISPRPSAAPVMSTCDISNSLQTEAAGAGTGSASIGRDDRRRAPERATARLAGLLPAGIRLGAQALPGGVHQFE